MQLVAFRNRISLIFPLELRAGKTKAEITSDDVTTKKRCEQTKYLSLNYCFIALKKLNKKYYTQRVFCSESYQLDNVIAQIKHSENEI